MQRPHKELRRGDGDDEGEDDDDDDEADDDYRVEWSVRLMSC